MKKIRTIFISVAGSVLVLGTLTSCPSSGSGIEKIPTPTYSYEVKSESSSADSSSSTSSNSSEESSSASSSSQSSREYNPIPGGD